MKANDDTPLLKLPLELREQIFAHVVGYETNDVAETAGGKLRISGARQRPDLPLLLTCRRIYSDAKDLLWKNHTFDNIELREGSETSLTNFVDCLTSRQREVPRSIRLSVWGASDLTFCLHSRNKAQLAPVDPRTLNRYLSLTGLRNVHFSFESWPEATVAELGDKLSLCNRWMRQFCSFRRPDVSHFEVDIGFAWCGTLQSCIDDNFAYYQPLTSEQMLRWEEALRLLLSGSNSRTITDRDFLIF